MAAILVSERMGKAWRGVPAPCLAQARTCSVIEAVSEDGVVCVGETGGKFRSIATRIGCGSSYKRGDHVFTEASIFDTECCCGLSISDLAARGHLKIVE